VKSPAKSPAKNHSVLTRVSPRTWLILILCLAAFLRFYQITTVPAGIQVDEAMNGSNILEILETGRVQVFYPENVGREGLFINLQAPFVDWFGNTPWALRIPSAIFGVLTVWGVYLLAVEMFSTSIGLLASFFVATSYWHMHFSRVGLRAICAPFFLTWGLYFLLAGMRRVRQAQPAIAWMVVAGAVYGLGFHTYIAYRTTGALVAGVLLYYFFHARREGWPGAFWKASASFAAAAVLVVGPLLLYFARNPGTFFGRTTQISIYRTDHPYSTLLLNIWKTAQMFFFEGDTNWRHNYDGQRELFWPVAILFAFGCAMALSAIWKKQERWFSYAVALVWIFLSAVPVVLSDDGVPHALRSILMIPAVFMLAAAGADRAYGYLAETVPQPARIAGVVLLLLFCCYEPYHTYFDLWATNPNVPPNYSASMVRLAEQFNRMPRSVPRYFALTSTGPSANGIPVMFQPFVYLTRSYTRKEQEETNIHYLTPETYRPPNAGHPPAAGKTFCEQVQASMPGALVTCVNLRF
jgi:4-amino-4-deoxy-L-arabinose transferase-like glycosyltransferase